MENGAYPAGNNPVLQLLANGSVSMATIWPDQALQALNNDVLPPNIKLTQFTDLPMPGGCTPIYAFNIHLTDSPNQPYQLLDIEYGAAASFIFGDSNEPSHLDWTEAAVAAGLQPLVVPWPTTLAIESQGYTDALRAVYPDVVVNPGFTWTRTTDPTEPEDHHDRIDFFFACGDGLLIEAAHVVGEKTLEADIVVTPWPSDHRAIAVAVRF